MVGGRYVDAGREASGIGSAVYGNCVGGGRGIMGIKLQRLGRVAELTRKYGVPRGFERLMNLLAPLGSLAGQQEVTFELDEGLRISADLDSHVDRRLYWHGYYNKHVECHLAKMAKEGNVVFDCGANVGMYSLRLARSVGSSGRVVAIEPHDLVRGRLEANIRLNGFQGRITVMSCALAGSRGKTVFHYPPAGAANQGNASLYRKGFDWQEKEVEVRTLDDIAEELNLSRLDIIRCDAQGAELSALRGGERTLRLFRPVISIRYNRETAATAGIKLGDVSDYMRGLGYAAFINRRGEFVRYTESMPVTDGEFLFRHGAG